MKKLIMLEISILMLFCFSCSQKGSIDTFKPTAIPIKKIQPKSDSLKIQIKKESLELSKDGFTEFYQAKYSSAIKTFEKAIQVDSKNHEAFCGKGFSLGFLGNYKKAHYFIDKSIQLNSKYGFAYYSKAFIYKLNKDLDNSLKYFEYSLKYDQKNPWTFFGISTIYADKGINDKSIEYLKKAVHINPSTKNEAKKQSHFDKIRHLKEFKELVNEAN